MNDWERALRDLVLARTSHANMLSRTGKNQPTRDQFITSRSALLAAAWDEAHFLTGINKPEPMKEEQ